MINIEYYIHNIPEAVSGFRKRFLVIRDLMIHGPVETFYYILCKVEVAPEAKVGSAGEGNWCPA